MVLLFARDWRDIAEPGEEPTVVESVDPPGWRGQFNRVDGAPGSATVDDLGPVRSDDRLGQGVVIGVTAAADRGLDPGLSARRSV